MDKLPNSPRKSVLGEYAARLRAFHPNARLYLISVIVTGATMGVFRLLFNFYVLSLGHTESLLGNLITTGNTTALILALPMGFLVDKVGRKPALMARTVVLSFAVVVMALWPSVAIFYLMNAMFGVAQSLSAVSEAPFLMENSGEKERTYLFSFSSGLRMGSVSLGSWLGGVLPTWVGGFREVAETDSAAYGGALLVIGLLAVIAVFPLIFVRSKTAAPAERATFAPLKYAREQPKLLGRLLLPSLFISIGAGFFMPFMNVFFREVHRQDDAVIGTLFAWGSLAMGIGLMIAPPIADRLGKIQLVALTQLLAIPFMGLLGFAPMFAISAGAYYIRMMLMNMSNPIYTTFVMEQVSASARSTVASLVSMVWNFGRALSPTISGYLQEQYGFNPPFIIAMTLYLCAIFLYWLFFLRKSAREEIAAAPVPGD